MSIYAGLGTQQPGYELFGGHLKAEYASDHSIFCGILGHIQGQCGFAHARSGGDDYEILALEAGSHLVEIGEAGGDPGYHLGPARHLLYLFEPAPCNFADGPESLPNAVFGNLKDQSLSLVYNGRRFVLLFNAASDDLIRGTYQSPQHRLGFYQPGIMLDGVGSGDAVYERGD